jgi:hypothetical protein
MSFKIIQQSHKILPLCVCVCVCVQVLSEINQELQGELKIGTYSTQVLKLTPR